MQAVTAANPSSARAARVRSEVPGPRPTRARQGWRSTKRQVRNDASAGVHMPAAMTARAPEVARPSPEIHSGRHTSHMSP